MGNNVERMKLHCHTDYSIKDGAQKPAELVEAVAATGAKAVTLTDHGVLMGTLEIVEACEKLRRTKGITVKPIPGVEAYVKEDNEDVRKHLILLAKDLQGYKAISAAVTDSGNRLVTVANKEIPTMNKAMLEKYFGEGSLGYNHVFATSACVQGVLASVINSNEPLTRAIEKAEKIMGGCNNPANPKYIEDNRRLSYLESEIKKLKENKKNVKKIANKPTAKAKATMEKHKDKSDYSELKANYENLLKEIDKANKTLESLDNKITSLEPEYKSLKKSVKEYEKTFSKYNKYKKIIDDSKAKMKDFNELMSMAKDEALWYQNLFGKGNFFIEIQYHGYENELYVMPKLIFLAGQLNIPMVPANDAHFATKDDYRKRAMLFADGFKRTVDVINEADKQLYIKTDAELREALLTITTNKILDKAFENLQIIEDNCNVVFPKETHYPVYKGLPEGMDAAAYLRKLAIEGIEKRYPGKVGWTKEYEDRMEYELGIIHQMGYDDYHLIVQDYLNYGRKIGLETSEGVGYTIGPGRGSGVGSLVNYLIGITNLDPLKYGLLFERYLNPERVSMPDIDADFAHEVRSQCIEYVKRKYGEKSVCGIVTKNTVAAKGALALAGRTNPATTNDIKRIDAIKKFVPKGTDVSLNGLYDPCDKTGPTVKDFLLEKFKDCPVERQIIEDAASVEGYMVSYGRHAAAIIISDTGDVSEQIPLMCNKDGEWGTQCDKVQAEDVCGLLKMDFLGLINLDIITGCIRKVKNNYGISINMNDVQFEDDVFKNIFATGKTNAVFQFSSPGMKKMLQRFAPNSFEDLILLVAAYRPGPMQYLDEIIDIKHGRRKPKYATSELESILSGTYSKPIYQEQVQEIFKKLAGYSLGQADLVRRAMSKKKLKELEKERNSFIHGDPERHIKGCEANGISEAVANKIFDELTAFASYGFNKSHAAAYALISYYTAWLKYHYPAEYMTSVIEESNYEDIPMYIEECEEMGLKIKLPSINESVEGFNVFQKNIQFGFKCMKGVGEIDYKSIIEERTKSKFISFSDFIWRTDITSKTLEALINGGALDSFGGVKNRKALINAAERLKDKKKKAITIKKKIEELNKQIEAETNDAEKAKLEKKIKLKFSAYEDAKRDFDQEYIMRKRDQYSENHLTRLLDERQVLGAFISGHPLDNYISDEKLVNIADVTEEMTGVTIGGIVVNLEKRKTRKGNEFLTFELDDGVNKTRSVIWGSDLPGLEEHISENAIVCLEGDIRIDKFRTELAQSESEDGQSGDKNLCFQFVARRIAHGLRKNNNPVLLSFPNCFRVYESFDLIKRYIVDNNGHALFLYDESLSRMRPAKINGVQIYVSKDILLDKAFMSYMGTFKK